MCNSDKYLSVSATDILFVVTLKYYQAVKKRRKHYDNFLLCTFNWGNNISLMGSKAVQSFPVNVLFMWILGGEPGGAKQKHGEGDHLEFTVHGFLTYLYFDFYRFMCLT